MRAALEWCWRGLESTMMSHHNVRCLLTDKHEALKNDGLTSLHRIILGESSEALRTQLQLDDTQVNVPDSHGWTPLICAAVRGDLEAVRALLEHGAKPQLAEWRGKTPLHYTAWDGHLDCAELLLEHGAPIDAREKYSRQPLHYAAAHVHPDSARMVDLLTSYGANVDEGGEGGETALNIAASYNNIWAADALISNGADINAGRANNTTPIMSGVCDNVIGTVKLLLKHGAKLDRVDVDGCNIFHYLGHHGNWHCLQAFGKADWRGVNPDRRDIWGHTPLDYFDGDRSYLIEHPDEGGTAEQQRQLFLSLLAQARSGTVEEIHDSEASAETAENEHGDARSIVPENGTDGSSQTVNTESDLSFEVEELSPSS